MTHVFVALTVRNVPGNDVVFDTAIWFDGFMGNTVVTMKGVFASADARDENVRKYGAEEGGRQTMARLAAYVASRSALAGH